MTADQLMYMLPILWFISFSIVISLSHRRVTKLKKTLSRSRL